MKIEASVSNFYEEAVEEVLISVRGDQSAKPLDMSGQEVSPESSVPISTIENPKPES